MCKEIFKRLFPPFPAPGTFIVIVVGAVLQQVMSELKPLPSSLHPSPRILILHLPFSFLRNFYASLQHHVDQYLVEVLDVLHETGLLNDTIVIATADHGEMGMSHGGLIQKCFNVYEETLKIPLVWSNPILWPQPQSSSALVSLVDMAPTLANLWKVPSSQRVDWTGVDFSSNILNPNAPSAQDYTIFT